MNYRAIPLECYCGEVPDQILEVGVTSDRHLVIHYWCSACKRVIFCTRTLEECRQFCPEPDKFPGETAADDARFLQSLGIASNE
jgi:hypothetical protein